MFLVGFRVVKKRIEHILSIFEAFFAAHERVEL